jgi:toxin ParE1/3/4
VTRAVRFHREARLELMQAIAWYESRQADLGREMLDAVDETISIIVKHPTLGARTERHGIQRTRRLLVSRFPFQIVYLSSSSEIAIVAVAHLKRKPGYWRGRE